MRRLEDIQKKRYFFHDIKDSELKEDWEWLIQQAELVQELKKQSHGIELDLLNDEVVRLEKQNKRYREALEVISQKRMAYADMAGVLRIAREALEGEE